MKKTRVLVLGNDPQINQIDFSRLSPDIITLGVNRIWLKHIPNYFFFNDLPIVTELEKNRLVLSEIISKSIIFSSDLINRDKKIRVPSWISVHARKNMLYFPDSVTTSIDIARNKYFNEGQYIFYFAGVSLTWQEPSHFWKELNYVSTNRRGSSWYSTRFDLIFNNFKRLKASGLDMISVHPNSRLNKLMRYENIENLYLTA